MEFNAVKQGYWRQLVRTPSPLAWALDAHVQESIRIEVRERAGAESRLNSPSTHPEPQLHHQERMILGDVKFLGKDISRTGI